MEEVKFKKIPQHIAIIPDGNRRWAVKNGMQKFEGYQYGIKPGVDSFKLCVELGIKEFTFFGFTQDNTKRPKEQVDEFTKACIESVKELSKLDSELIVIGKTDSEKFPKELLKYTKRTKFNNGKIKVNFLVNYGWQWDLKYAYDNCIYKEDMLKNIASSEISKIDLVVRWGGRHRLSGILPVQTVYSDIYVVDDMWPDYKPEHLYNAMSWYQSQDDTLGG